MRFLNKLKEKKIRKQWRTLNSHNGTWMKNMFSLECVEVGKGTYGGIYVANDAPNVKLKVGHYCSIADEVKFLLGVDHYTDHISTYPYKVKVIHSATAEAISKGNIVVDDDVWIGERATILSGVHIGQGAIIAAGAVVVKDVPPYSIVGGVPAQVIKYRFSDELIEKMMMIDYSKLDINLIKQNIDKLYEPFEKEEQISWLPKLDTPNI